MTGTDIPAWGLLADSAARFLGTVQALTDDDLRQASALPRWTRAHVLTHVGGAADSRTGLLRAARAGRVGRQYPSEQARAEAIDAGALRPLAVIRADTHRAVTECLTAIREHPSQLWDAPAIWLGPGRRPVRRVILADQRTGRHGARRHCRPAHPGRAGAICIHGRQQFCRAQLPAWTSADPGYELPDGAGTDRAAVETG